MSLSPTRNRRLEVVECQSLAHRDDVVVEVSTDYDRSVWVLTYDISDDVQDSFGSVLQVLLFSRVEITVKHLDIRVAELELSPTHVSPE